ncbi:type 2 lanthipeptide synthetase LanM family protein [Dolichospermum lemmermannii CS-548]|uniref:type 2 lanthipeptide synthetase LanM family protein n=1 Tax=Dolichospermum lemmermannii TaxID=54295 RepID=UPI00232CE87E|nr:type 2 lanthipeptide synthetase LanM family protein [Dolichospermum lemmermannii]MDB9436313.1 type 2 lanthipeptide synthetase LanM family protein [Dolichospermum lemmermannii CS-548]
MEFTKKELKEISDKASTLSERLHQNFSCKDNYEHDYLYRERIERWCQVVADGNWEQFRKRLLWDCLDINKLSKILNLNYTNNLEKLPTWVKILNECLKLFEDLDLILQNDNCLDVKDPFPYEKILLPFIQWYRKELVEQVGYESYTLLSRKAHLNLERSLLNRISSLCVLSLEVEFSIFKLTKQSSIVRSSNQKLDNITYYNFFIDYLCKDNKLLDFFRDYPVLARLVITAVESSVDADRELITHLISDLSDIKKISPSLLDLGKVVNVQQDISDFHSNGRSVRILQFESGFKLVYKPRNLGVDKIYLELLDWLNVNKCPFDFRLFKIIDKSTYGWVEFVETISCKNTEELKHYYQRMGALLCLAYTLDATDLHCENLIACGEYPVLIDLETLMHPTVKELYSTELTENTNFTTYVQDLADHQFCKSVLRTSLLPEWHIQESGFTVDGSGLGGVGKQEEMKNWYQTYMNHLFEFGEKQTQQDLRQEYDFSLRQKYAELSLYYSCIIEGFKETYHFLMTHRLSLLSSSPIAKLEYQEVRFICRQTQTYASILKRTLNPKFLRNGVERSIEIDMLSKAMIVSDTKPIYWHLLDIEKQTLECLDIPLFRTSSSSNALRIDVDRVIENTFVEPSFAIMIKKINALNEKDLKRQILFIQGSFHSRSLDNSEVSLSSTSSYHSSSKIPSLTQEDLVRKALLVAEGIREQSFRSTDGSLTWFAPQYKPSINRFQFQQMSHELYQGVAGVCLFLAAIEKVTGTSEFRDVVFGGLQSFRHNLRDEQSCKNLKLIGIGGATGLGSILYVLTRISKFLDEPNLLDDAKFIASIITDDMIESDQSFDIISGASGTILGLLTLYSIIPETTILNKAIMCGEHLLKNRTVSQSGYRTWGTLNNLLLTGLSHGAAGIAYTLLRLYEITSKADFLEAAYEAILYEQSVFSNEEKNWPDFRLRPHDNDNKTLRFMNTWCNGAPGIGLARLGGLTILDTPEIQRDIESAIQTTVKTKLTQIDHLCCGNFGRIEFLFAAGQKLSSPQLLKIVEEQVSQIINSAQQRGHFGYGSFLTCNSAFFQGASGIGYQLLRLAYPDQLPSVLLWE